MPKVDLNSDLGEGYGPWTKADDDGMLALVSSANVACGGHASDPETMYTTLRNAMARRVVIGAHPGYADRAGFGRRVIPMAPDEIGRMVATQIGSLQAIAALAGATVRYVKPHGALGNLAADKRDVADAIADAVGKLPGKLAILAISGTELELSARAKGMPVFSEIFADRNYLKTGRLVPRSHPEAMIHEFRAGGEAAGEILRDGPDAGNRRRAHSPCRAVDLHPQRYAGGGRDCRTAQIRAHRRRSRDRAVPCLRLLTCQRPCPRAHASRRSPITRSSSRSARRSARPRMLRCSSWIRRSPIRPAGVSARRPPPM